MKLSTLLLSSAAIVVAGSAYAADLPAKKGAPAAKAATGCPAFGAGYFQIPGSDNCIKFSGFVRSQFANTSTTTSLTPSAELGVSIMSNTDMGALSSGFRQSMDTSTGATGNNAADRAYIGIGGLTMGKYGAQTDIGTYNGTGTAAMGGGGDSGTGVKYTAALGGVNVTVAAQTNSGLTSGSTAQDIIVLASGSAGAFAYKAAFVNHPYSGGTGNAYLGNVSFTQGAVTFGAFASSARGAGKYTGASTVDTSNATSSNMGGSVAYNYGAGSAYAEYYQINDNGSLTPVYEVGISHTVTKNLTAKPSLFSSSNSNTVYLRITRDF